MIIKTNSFAKRQTKESKFSHFETSIPNPWEFLEGYLEEIKGLIEIKPGVFKIAIDPVITLGVTDVGPNEIRFYSPIHNVTINDKLIAVFESRREGEDPYVHISCEGSKTPAKFVDIILYAHEHLGNEAETDADYEIISINARIDEEEPPTPLAMARNYLNLTGGTKTDYSPEEFARAIVYWSTRTFVKESQ